MFEAKFRTQWGACGLQGDLYPGLVLGPGAPAGTQALAECQSAFFARLFQEVLGFAGVYVCVGGVMHVWVGRG